VLGVFGGVVVAKIHFIFDDRFVSC